MTSSQSPTTHPLVDRYLTHLREGLAAMPTADREEVERDIRSHIAEAMAAGTPLDTVLTHLGPADALARAYTVELLLDGSRSKAAGLSWFQRLLALAGLLVLTSIPTIVVVSVLGSIGISFTLSGVAVLGAGLAAAAGLTQVFGYDLVLGIHAVWAVVLGPLMTVTGFACLVGLYYYLRWLAQTLIRVQRGA
jgi:uncharacterized membrane protein